MPQTSPMRDFVTRVVALLGSLFVIVAMVANPATAHAQVTEVPATEETTTAPAPADPAPAATDDEFGPGSVQYSSDGAVIKFSSKLLSAGRGQDPQSGSACVITAKNGYTLGDETTADNNLCAGDTATYQMSFSVDTGDKDRVIRITPDWESYDVLPGFPAPNQYPTISFQPVATTGVTYVKDGAGSYTFTFKRNPGATYSIAWTGTVKTQEPRLTTKPQAGAFQLGTRTTLITAGGSEQYLGTAIADRKINVLETNRNDQQIKKVTEDTVWTTFGADNAGADFSPNAPAAECRDDEETGAPSGTRYRGIAARSNLPASWDQMYASAMPNGYDKYLGVTNNISENQLSRYTLDLEGAGWGNEVISYYNGERVETTLDENGNPYIQRRYTASTNRTGVPVVFKFYIPENRLVKGNNIFTTRLDAVDENGSTNTTVENYYGEKAEFPALANNPAAGSNQVDPGNGQECSVSTDTTQGTVAGRAGFPNNNCARNNIRILDECVPGDRNCGVSNKRDVYRGNSYVTLEGSTIGKEPKDAADVHVTLAPDVVKQDPSVCIGWDQGAQYLLNDELKVGNSRLQEVFPNAKVWVTTDSGDGTNCDKLNWEPLFDADKGIDKTFSQVYPDRTKISGFYIALPGVKLSERPIDINWIVRGASPQYLETAEKVQGTDGATYAVTKNYATVKSACTAPTQRLEARIAFSRPKAGVSAVTESLTPPAQTTLGRQQYIVNSRPTLNFVNGTAAVNSTIANTNGEPVQVVHRSYLSKCLDVDVDLLPKNARFIGGPASTDPDDCGPDPDRYIEQTWALGNQPSEDPYNQPFFTGRNADWADRNASASNTTFTEWDPAPIVGTTQNVFAYPVFTPVWAAPNNHFKVIDVWNLTGTPMAQPDGYPFTDKISALPGQDVGVVSAVTWGPKNEPEPAAYEPLSSAVRGLEITIPSVDVVMASKAAVDSLVPVNGQFTHAINIQNQTQASFGPSEYIDLLPYNGDGRGTHYTGEYWLNAMPRYAGDDQNLPIEYTTDAPATISQCPVTASDSDLTLCQTMADKWGRAVDAQRNTSNWQVLTPEVIEAQRGPNRGPRITALRLQSRSFVSEANRTYYLDFGTDANSNDDLYKNSIGVVSINDDPDSALQGAVGAPAPDAVETAVYSGLISGTIYEDTNRDGDDNEGDVPAPTAHVVKLMRCFNDPAAEGGERCDAEPYRQIVVPAGQGDYEFNNLPAGNYKVVVETASDQEINTESGKKPENIGTWQSGTLVINGFSPARNGGTQEAVTDVDFGYYVAEPEVTLNKTVNDPEVGRDTEGAAVFTLEGKNSGDVQLTDVVLKDVFSRDPQLELSCVLLDVNGAEIAGNDKGNILAEPGVVLEVGEGYRCTATMEQGRITQADIDTQAKIVNNATISGKYKSRTVTSDSEATVPLVERNPHLTLTKIVDGQEEVAKAEGETAQFVVTVTNDGNITLNHVTIDDDFGKREFTKPFLCVVQGDNERPFTLGEDSLAPKETISCAADYVVTQADIDGQRDIVNTATPKADYPTPEDGRTPYAGDPDSATITIAREVPSIELGKEVRNVTADAEAPFATSTVAANNQRLEYRVTFTNTSKVTIKGVTLKDVTNGEEVDTSTFRCFDDENKPFAIDGSRDLARAKTVTCTYTTTSPATMVDDATTLNNVATVEGTATDPSNPDATITVSDEDNATVTPEKQNSAVVLTKKVGVDQASATEEALAREAGESATFAITIENTGNTTLKDVNIVEEWDHEDEPLTLTCENGWQSGDSLAAGERKVCWATYKVTQDDVDATTQLSNRAYVDAKTPAGKTLYSERSEAFINLPEPPARPDFLIEKTANGKKLVENLNVGDPVEFSVRLVNNDRFRLSGAQFTDIFHDTKFTCIRTKDGAEVTPNGDYLMDVKEEIICTGTYVVTQDDVDRGISQENSASFGFFIGAKDRGTNWNEYTSSASIVPVAKKPSIVVDKRVRPADAEVSKDTEDKQLIASAGQDVLFDFWIINNGNITLEKLSVSDTFGAEPANPAFTCFDGVAVVDLDTVQLSPGASLRCTTNDPYTVTQADINSGGSIKNTVDVTAVPVYADQDNLEAATLKDSSDASIKMPTPQPALTLTKTVNDAKVSTVELGKEAVFTLKAVNTGNVTLTNSKLVEDSFNKRDSEDAADAKPLPELRECVKFLGDEATADKTPIDPNNFVFEPGETVTCITTPYVVTQADIDGKRALENKASVTGEFTDPEGQKQTPKASDYAVVEMPEAAAEMRLNKDVSDAVDGTYENSKTIADGKDAFFRITGGNTGTLTLRNVKLDDDWAKDAPLDMTCTLDGIGTRFAVGESLPELAPGQMFTCTGTYRVTDEDRDAQKSLDNKAKLSAQVAQRNGELKDLTDQTADATVNMVKASGSLKLNKLVNDEPVVTLPSGGAANWTITGVNDGNVTLTDVKLGDSYPKGKDKPNFVCSIDGGAAFDMGDKITLAPGESFTCAANVPGFVNIDDVVTGEDLVNTAQVEYSYTDDKGSKVTKGEGDPGTTATATVKVADAKPEFTLTKTVDYSAANPTKSEVTISAGETAYFSITGTNTGNVPLEKVTLTDEWVKGKADLDCGDFRNGKLLNVGDSFTCTFSYTATDEDAKANSTLLNTAKLNAEFRGDSLDEKTATATVKVPATTTELRLNKAIDGPVEYVEGQTVNYTFTVTNTGNTQLGNIEIVDPMFGEPFACGQGILNPGTSISCPNTHLVTAADAAAGVVVNTARAQGSTLAEAAKPGEVAKPGTRVVSNEAKATFVVPKPVPAVVEPAAISLDKAIKDAKEYVVGETVTYTFTVTNTGKQDLHDVKITDPMFGDEPFVCAAELAVGKSATCEKTHEVTEADQAAGAVVNTASVSALDPANAVVPGNKDTAVFRVRGAEPPVVEPAAISLVKAIEGATEYAVGETVTYTFTVTNTGKQELRDVVIVDKMFGDEPFTCGEGTLAVGASTECTKTHVVTEADAKAVTVVNVAQAQAKDTTGGAVNSTPATAKFTVPAKTLPGAASLKLTKEISNGERFAEGEAVNYTFTVENTGLQTLKNIQIDDPMFSDVVCDADELAAGESATCTATHIVTAADAAAGSVINTATATGEDEFGATVTSSPDKAVFVVPAPVPAESALTLGKAIKGAGSTTPTFAEGDTVTYEFTLTNTGDTELSDLRITDRMFGDEPFVCGAETLAAGASTTCEKTHVVTAEDAKAGTVVNTATASAKNPAGGAVNTAPATATFTTAKAAPSITLAKKILGEATYRAGDTVTYEFTVTNTGDTELRDVTITDAMLGAEPFACGEGTLAPGESTTCTKTYKVTAEDSGVVVNTATAAAKTDKSVAVTSAPATAEFTVFVEGPALSLVKSADTTGPVAEGSKVVYTFTVTNTGNTPLEALAIVDAKLEAAGVAVTCDDVTLAPGAKTVCRSGEYTVTASEVNAGDVVNTAHATAKVPGSDTAVDSNESTVTIPAGKPTEGSSVSLWPLIPALLIPAIIGGGSSTPPAPQVPALPTEALPAPAQPAPAQPAPAPAAPAPAAPTGIPPKGIPRTLAEARYLANTGASVIGIVGGGAILIVAGSLLVASARRRKHQD